MASFPLDKFNQNEYSETFYCCDSEHPFIAFTTCYCPLCSSESEFFQLTREYEQLAQEHEMLTETHLEIVAKARNLAPELLL